MIVPKEYLTSDFPRGWKWLAMRDVTHRPVVVEPRKSPEARFKYIDISSIDNSKSTIVSARELMGKDAPTRARQLVRASDTLYSTVRVYLKNLAQVPPDLDGSVASTGFCVLRPNDLLDADFLFYWVQTAAFTSAAAALQRGISYPAVNESDLLNIAVPVPPFAEQRAIVATLEELLSRIDAAVVSLRRIRQRSSAARSSVLAAVVSGRLIQGRVNPDSWHEARVSELVARLQYGTSSKASTDSGGVPVLRMGNIRDGRIDYTELKYLPADHPDLPGTLLEPGDILFNRTNSPELVGKSAVFRGYSSAVSFASYLVRLSPLSHVNPAWLAAVINSPFGREYISTVRVQQVGQANVSAKKIGAMRLQVPPREVQDALAAEMEKQVEGLDLVLRTVSANLARGSRLRQSILATAFTGRLVKRQMTAQTERVPAAAVVGTSTGVAR